MSRRSHRFQEEDSGRPGAGCGAFSGRLDLYLEDEIADAREAERIREHLAWCRACASYARDYEALTWAILESEAAPPGPRVPGGGPLGEERVARAVERILLSVPERRGAASRPRRVALPTWAAAAAAAVVALGFWLSSGGPRRLPGPDAARGGGMVPPLARTGLRAAEAEEANPAEGLLRWLLREERGSPSLAASPRACELYGFRVRAARGARPGLDAADAVLEWVVEAGWQGAPRKSVRRFFLVPDGPAASELEAREIFPVSWFPAARSGHPPPAAFLAGNGAAGAYVQIVVVDGVSLAEWVISLPVPGTRASWTDVLDWAEVEAPSSPFGLFSGPY